MWLWVPHAPWSQWPLCSPADGPSHTGPSNLEILERGLDQLRIRWTAASGPVTGYRVQRVPLTGLGQPIVAERQEVSAPTCLLGVPGGPWQPHVWPGDGEEVTLSLPR